MYTNTGKCECFSVELSSFIYERYWFSLVIEIKVESINEDQTKPVLTPQQAR